jgi:hypothetical protein
MIDSTETRFRASARFELKQLAELTAEQREPLRELENDPSFFGLLVPRDTAGANIKSVGSEIAALLRHLAAPAVLAIDGDIIDLVLDGVLEIEVDDVFLSGPDALPHLVDPQDAAEPCGIARISFEALRHAEDLESTDAAAASAALYFYNRIPISRFWRARFPDRAAVLAHLGVERDAVAAMLRGWRQSSSQGWISWTPRGRRHVGTDAPIYKLYVSPRPENIREAFEGVIRALTDVGPVDFKIGEDASGLLRPDKLVLYFGSREELDRAANAILSRLSSCPAHGVPFTAGIDDAGLLSWGVDPPDSERTLSWMGRESWRLWLAGKLGDAIAFAKGWSTPLNVEPWRFARERVRRLGVDVDRWTPNDSLWRPA